MTRISEENIKKIKEAILSVLFHSNPKAIFGAEVAREIVRDEEFVKKLLVQLEKENLITSIRKNNNGCDYSRRIRWRLTSKAYSAYKEINQQKN